MPPVESGSSPKLDLPPPVTETGASSEMPRENPIRPEIIAPIPQAPNSNKTPVLSNPPIQQIDFKDPLAALTPSPGVALATTNIVAPLTADDGDLIEKEWVTKAKKIVESNSNDPYKQSKELTIFKADYMKKRYNKIVNISE